MGARSDIKRWLRPRNVLILIALAIVTVFAWVGVEIWRLHHARPVIAVDYRQQLGQATMQQAGTTLAECERAWAALICVTQLASDVEQELRQDPHAEGFHPRGEDDDGWMDFRRVSYGRTLPPDIDREREALRVLRVRGFFAQFEAFEAMGPGLRPTGTKGPMLAEVMPELARARTAAKALAASMRIAAESGDLDETVRNFNASLALAATTSLQPTLISGLVSIAIEALIFSELNALLMEHAFNATQCQAMLSAMQRHACAGLAHTLESERLVFLDTVQNFFTDDGQGNGYMIPGELEAASAGSTPSTARQGNMLATLSARFILADRRETIEAFEKFMQQLQIEAALPPAQRWSSGFDPDAFVDSLPRKQFLVRMLVPAVRKAANQWGISEVQREATRLMLVLALYRAKHGAFPPSLTDLVPGAIPQAPIDPFNQNPWGYRLLANDPYGRPYLLYSTGYDGIDNRGTLPPGVQRYQAISDRSIHGVDYIVNVPREEH